MLMKFMQQEYFSGGWISCCLQMKTDKIKGFPEESVQKLFCMFSCPIHIECYPRVLQHLFRAPRREPGKHLTND